VSVELPFRWEASWVWLGDTGHRPDPMTATRATDVIDRFVLLRRTFDLDERPQAAVLRAVANSRLVAWVNGRQVCHGPVRSDPRGVPAEVVRVEQHLRRGRNSIAILGRYYGAGTSWWLPGPVTLGLGGASVAAELRTDDGLVLGTDETWRALPGSAWTAGPPPTGLGGFLFEMVDARELPVGWTEPDFDESAWTAAEVLDARNTGTGGVIQPPTDPYGPLPPRPIPQLTGDVRRPRRASVLATSPGDEQPDPIAQVVADQASADRSSITAVADPTDVELPAGTHLVAFDFGETVAGGLVVELVAPSGAELNWGLAEEVDSDGLAIPFFTHGGLRYLARGDADLHESFDPMGGRYGVASVRSDGAVRLRVAVRERLFPRNDAAVRFACSDPLLEQVFETGLRTIDLCSQDAYIDCPTREQRAWTGDAVVHQSVHLAVSDDWSLARWYPVLAHALRTDGMLPMNAAANVGGHPLDGAYIPDWALHWIRAVHNLMRYTGDRDLVGSLLVGCESVLRWFLPYQDDDGLLRHVPGWVLIDWSNVSVRDTSAALNGLWARGLRDFEQMARWLGDDGRAGWAARRRREISDAFETFWDADRGLYRDHRVDGVVQPAVSRHANAAAICGGIVPDERLAALAERLADRSALAHSAPAIEKFAAGDFAAGVAYIKGGNPAPAWDVDTKILEAQPFFRYVVHDALAEAGRADLVADACRDWRVFLEAGEASWPETWAGGSHCHGWSSTPTRDLIVYTLGIAPAEPGYGRVRLAPRLGDLEWAEATVPTPAGPLWVRATPDAVEFDSPLPVLVDDGRHTVDLPPGRNYAPLNGAAHRNHVQHQGASR
jgi:hypothetical protein